MALIRESSHFIPVERIPLIHDATPLPDVFNRLHELGAGGFVLLSERPRYYVQGRHLAELVLARARERGWGEVARETSRSLLEDATLQLATAPVSGDPVSAEDDITMIPGGATGIFPVTSDRGLIGWYVPEGRLWRAIYTRTQPLVWICEFEHENSSFDSGYCDPVKHDGCPGKITTYRTDDEDG
jgi:hypothetical protein